MNPATRAAGCAQGCRLSTDRIWNKHATLGRGGGWERGWKAHGREIGEGDGGADGVGCVGRRTPACCGSRCGSDAGLCLARTVHSHSLLGRWGDGGQAGRLMEWPLPYIYNMYEERDVERQPVSRLSVACGVSLAEHAAQWVHQHQSSRHHVTLANNISCAL